MKEYPEDPGFKEKGDTSEEAAENIASKAATLRLKTFTILKRSELTADEVAERMNEAPGNIRPRVSELRKEGLVEPTGQRRQNISGASAKVWRAVTKEQVQQDLPL